MIKKNYITPNVILRKVLLEDMITTSIDGEEVGFGDANARGNDDWDDEEEGNIWED